jgi:SsrA-binding protein
VTRETGQKVIATNKKARHDYAILKTWEAGLVLSGTEVKSLRAGHVSIRDAFAGEHEGELMLYGLHIAEWGFGSWTNHAPRRTRKLLLTKRELKQLAGNSITQGLTIIPLRLFVTDRGFAKVEIALAQGKKHYDKREDLKAKDQKREMERY